jgi:hypothetical protein
MNFPSGLSVALPTDLHCSNLSGPRQVRPPEQGQGFASLTDVALERLAENLLKLMDEVAAEEKRGGMNPSLRDYVELLDRQVTSELLRRSGLACPHCGEPCAETVTVEYDAMVDGPGCVMSEERCRSCAGYAP